MMEGDHDIHNVLLKGWIYKLSKMTSTLSKLWANFNTSLCDPDVQSS